jgi:predicted nucleic acid-binding protein
MTASLGAVFADTAYWIALLVKQDQYHERARAWTPLINGRITTTGLVLLETANTLARPAWRASAVALIEHLQQRPDVDIVPPEPALWPRGWTLYRDRPDKGWSLTDCVSFLVMQEARLTDALTTDEHFRQAGFRAVLLEDPTTALPGRIHP